MHVHIEAPYYGNPAPEGPSGQALWRLWDYEGSYSKCVFSKYFLSTYWDYCSNLALFLLLFFFLKL